LGGELVRVLGGELVVDALLGHVHQVGVGLGRGERVLVPGRLDVVDRVRRRLLGALAAVRGGGRVGVPLLGHVHRVGVALGLGQGRGMIGRDVGLLGRCLLGRLLLVLDGGILSGGILRGGLLRGLVGDVLRGGLCLLGGLLRAGDVVGVVA